MTENQNQKERRKSLFDYLTDIIEVSHKKATSRGRGDYSQQGWSRIMISAINSYGSLLKDSTLEELEERVERLEKLEQSLPVLHEEATPLDP
ncbi:MAG: hypothetical protein NWF05_08925 [Candidatus Bathyarchaeota archaeon]|nr:hypothetical protein [Candidatus Bathyarchaeota archaeon]